MTQLSILVHPDKNSDDADRAQQAFEGKCRLLIKLKISHEKHNSFCVVINRAWKILENDKTRKRCLEIVEEATGMTDLAVIIYFKLKFSCYSIVFSKSDI